MKKYRVGRGIAILLFVSAFYSCNNSSNDSVGNDAVLLKLNLKPGAKYKYVKESKEVIQPEIKGTPISINQDMTVESVYQLSPDNNNKKITFSFERVAIKSGNSLISLEYDSQDPNKQGQEIFHDIQKVLHKPRTASITPDGAIFNITGSDNNANTTDSTKSSSNEQLTQFSDSSVHAMLDQLFNIYPNKPVKLGDTWKTHATTYVSFIKANIDNNYKLTSFSNNIAQIEINANIVSDTDSNTGVKDLKMRGIETGTMDIDVNTGLILDCKLSRKLEGTMDMMGTPAPTTITSDIHITGREQ